jgi:hypothetical protein
VTNLLSNNDHQSSKRFEEQKLWIEISRGMKHAPSGGIY